MATNTNPFQNRFPQQGQNVGQNPLIQTEVPVPYAPGTPTQNQTQPTVPAANNQQQQAQVAQNVAQQQSYSGSSGGGGGGAAAPTAGFNLNIKTPKLIKNEYIKPKMPKKATDQQKAEYWQQYQNWLNGEAGVATSEYNVAQAELNKLEAELGRTGYVMTQEDAQKLLNARQKVADAQTKVNTATDAASKIKVSVGVQESKDGDKNSVTKTYTITDDQGNTVTTTYSEDNGGMTAAELRQKQQADQQRVLTAQNSKLAASAAREVETIQAGAERDYAIGSAKSAREAYMGQYNQNLGNINADYESDQLEGNQDLLMASNETFNQAVKNSREAQAIMGQYNLGGSSLGNRLANIASEAANQANQVAALTYNQRMQEGDRNYADARLALEQDRTKQENAYNQSVTQAAADYYARIGAQAGKNAASISQYANPLYWQGLDYTETGKRLTRAPGEVDQNQLGGASGTLPSNKIPAGSSGLGSSMGGYPTTNNMSAASQVTGGVDRGNIASDTYGKQKQAYYERLAQAYSDQQQQAAQNQASQKAAVYTSDYVAPAAKTYQTGLREYRPVNSTTSVPGQSLIETDTRKRQL